jgi:hypothetical protein
MNKFKIGDRVKIASKRADRFHLNDNEFTITHSCGPWDGEESWGSTKTNLKGLESFGLRWKESELELVTPTTFEVGKMYKHSSYALPPFTVLFIGETHAFVRRGKDEWVVSLKNYNKHEEYIPPPPEEWRIVYKGKCGEITVGVHPFISDSEARSSNFWNSKAYKTIRIDE